MHFRKRVLPFFFSLVLAVGLIPSAGFAVDQADSPDVSTAAIIASGTLGNCAWEFDGETLTVHAGDGSGVDESQMLDYNAAKVTAKTIVFKAANDDTEYVRGFTDTASLISGASNVETLDLSGLDTASSETNMSGMFNGCDKLSKVIAGKEFSFKNSQNALVCELPMGQWKVESTGNIMSGHDASEAKSPQVGETYTKQNDSGQTDNKTSYTVNYLEQGTNKVLASAKTENDRTVGTSVTETAADITGYNVDSPTKSLTLDTTNNVITFYYTARNDLSYTVNYLERGTNTPVADAKITGDKTFGETVEEHAITIPGYKLDTETPATITIGISDNVINFYYIKSDSGNGGNNGDGDNNGDNPGDGDDNGDDNPGGNDNPGDGDDNGDDNPGGNTPSTPTTPGTSGSGDSDSDDSNNSGDVEAPTHAVMHRLYNPNSGEHFFTMSAAEKAHLTNLGWKDEGEGWVAATSGTAVYRLYNPNAGEHHYTTSQGERAALITAGWNDEGIGFYSDDDKGTPLYRLYNPNEFANNHHYTRNTAERDMLKALGWHDEGIGWYGIS